MSGFRRFFNALRSLFAPARRPPDRSTTPSPGRSGRSATVEVDPRNLRDVRLDYRPTRNASPDPGEIVWTWVPFEERDGRGKDRPVVVVAALGAGAVLAVQLTSKDRTGHPDYVALGVGDWDRTGRSSWVNIDRIFAVQPSGMRREAALVDSARYARIASALRGRYGWR
ncbi:MULTISPECIES: type II toxin-antitoxin system PemK/MazF family toxin [unclassified Cryobacterium]|uniref:type II toxin-antitoxin system PemK/MazF family toxin n=1 Tax=unclassified Cryobacterium TaxID=2649013 RepID=UPI002AB4A613|nr:MULTISPECIES: type II toxin-antitoxin system PemK/MazF family toxin [unclassified Cryobacterium]MDY7544089.1 type II toxin-antitoxin system PemK/MazF family toxin [Cryobacterium sp. 5B3]MEA9997945.1 type II toxin-antitoxin system PemK/MazF family toxin [Cryobacterium sp. RTS3]MEB0265201.1 type II toxin-antitoxin system PemK/MazF family toxin [Cryobacterium sp. 10I5]MEB0273276.1 type II toxin-antitoxin system PemK/MazF family toxin [Cryobacterium sp. 5B3]